MKANPVLVWVTLSTFLLVVIATDQIILPNNLVASCYEDGQEWLLSTNEKYSYETLMVHGTSQLNDSYAGVASGVMVLNSLYIPAPLNEQGYPYFTQQNFFSAAVQEIISAEQVAQDGMTYEQLSDALNTYDYGDESNKKSRQLFVSRPVGARDLDVDQFRDQVREYMSADAARVIVDFDRKVLAQDTGASMGVLLAYSNQKDAFLLYDVARYKFACSSYWVPTQKLYDAMHAKDSTGEGRGYILIDNDFDSTKEPKEKKMGGVITVIVFGAIFYTTAAGLVAILLLASVVAICRRGRRFRPMDMQA